MKFAANAFSAAVLAVVLSAGIASAQSPAKDYLSAQTTASGEVRTDSNSRFNPDFFD